MPERTHRRLDAAPSTTARSTTTATSRTASSTSTCGRPGYVKLDELRRARAPAGVRAARARCSPRRSSRAGLTAPANYKATLDAAGRHARCDVERHRPRASCCRTSTTAYRGAAPDLGALERGCPLPIYGVRPEGIDETNEPIGCTSATADAGVPDSGSMPPPDANTGGAGGSSGAGGHGGAAGNAGSGAGLGGGGGAGGRGGTGVGGADPDGGDTTGTSGAGGTGGAGPTESQSGCGCTTARNASPGGPAALCLLALVFRRRKAISAV